MCTYVSNWSTMSCIQWFWITVDHWCFSSQKVPDPSSVQAHWWRSWMYSERQHPHWVSPCDIKLVTSIYLIPGNASKFGLPVLWRRRNSLEIPNIWRQNKLWQILILVVLMRPQREFPNSNRSSALLAEEAITYKVPREQDQFFWAQNCRCNVLDWHSFGSKYFENQEKMRLQRLSQNFCFSNSGSARMILIYSIVRTTPFLLICWGQPPPVPPYWTFVAHTCCCKFFTVAWSRLPHKSEWNCSKYFTKLQRHLKCQIICGGFPLLKYMFNWHFPMKGQKRGSQNESGPVHAQLSREVKSVCFQAGWNWHRGLKLFIKKNCSVSRNVSSNFTIQGITLLCSNLQ